jgi:hypothetical protein
MDQSQRKSSEIKAAIAIWIGTIATTATMIIAGLISGH